MVESKQPIFNTRVRDRVPAQISVYASLFAQPSAANGGLLLFPNDPYNPFILLCGAKTERSFACRPAHGKTDLSLSNFTQEFSTSYTNRSQRVKRFGPVWQIVANFFSSGGQPATKQNGSPSVTGTRYLPSHSLSESSPYRAGCKPGGAGKPLSPGVA